MAERPSDDQRNSATFAALAMLAVISAGLLGLIAFVLPQALWLVVVAIGLGLSVVMHYFLWGRWLSAKLHAEEDAAQRAKDDAASEE
jgi:fatty acid desaturase